MNRSERQRLYNGRNGVIISYDAMTNTATVLISKAESDEIDEVLPNVLCPVKLGLQSIHPEPGQQCWVAFKGGSLQSPLIVSYFNVNYEHFNYQKQNRIASGIPNYLIGS